MERAVSRGELGSPASSPEPAFDPDLVEQIKEITRFEYVTNDAGADGNVPEGNGEDDLEFRLFSISKPADTTAPTPTANKIRLRSPTPQNLEPGFIVPERPNGFYFHDVSAASGVKYKAAALSGAEVLALSHKSCPANAYPWKVLHVSSSAQSKATTTQNALFAKLVMPDGESGGKRKRLGKKARIRVRVKYATAKAQSEKAKADAASKQIAEKKKRARRNREKKLKKRAKGRAAKAAGGEGGMAGDDEASDGSESGGEDD